MKKLLSVAMCLALGLAVTGCEMPGAEEEMETETPTVEAEVDGAAVEVVLPTEAIEVIETALGDEAAPEKGTEEEVLVEDVVVE